MLALVHKWREAEQRFRGWYSWVMENNSDIRQADTWMDEVAKFQTMLVERDVAAEDRKDALLRLRLAHLFYPAVTQFAADVQVSCNFVMAGIDVGEFVDVQVHDTDGSSILLSDVLAVAATPRVLVVAGSSS